MISKATHYQRLLDCTGQRAAGLRNHFVTKQVSWQARLRAEGNRNMLQFALAVVLIDFLKKRLREAVSTSLPDIKLQFKMQNTAPAMTP